jgi:hypothetical protein
MSAGGKFQLRLPAVNCSTPSISSPTRHPTRLLLICLELHTPLPAFHCAAAHAHWYELHTPLPATHCELLQLVEHACGYEQHADQREHQLAKRISDLCSNSSSSSSSGGCLCQCYVCAFLWQMKKHAYMFASTASASNSSFLAAADAVASLPSD